MVSFICIFLFTFSTTFAGGEEFSVKSSKVSPSTEKRKNILTTILEFHSSRFLYKSLSVLIDDTLIEPRGRIQGPRITLSSHILRDGEFTKLFVHELGHYVDLYVFPLLVGGDISDNFYSISWTDTTVKRPGEVMASFVSGYASTNKYEDFAESFTFYIFHNTYFADKALRNESLRQKYLFLSKEVFPGGQFIGKDFSTIRIPNYVWDTTKTPISLQKYLYSLK